MYRLIWVGALLCAGCASPHAGLFGIDPETACSITTADVDAHSGAFSSGDINAQGRVIVRRGSCTEADWQAFRAAVE